MESICTVIFSIVLLLPLILQLQILIADPGKLLKIFHYHAIGDNGDRESAPKLLQHYPKTPIPFDTGSDSKLTLARLRTIYSSPALSNTGSAKKDSGGSDKTILPETRHSSAFVKTDEVLPVVDITWTYDSYRYKTFEDSLRSQYGNNYPPGRVVLNSMQLNLPEPRTKVEGGSISGGLFDFIKESDAALAGLVSRKLEIEYLNPLDHFVMRQLERPLTEEKFTEMPPDDRQEASPYNGKGVESFVGTPQSPAWKGNSGFTAIRRQLQSR